MIAPAQGLRACFEILVELSEPERTAWLDTYAIEPALREQLRGMLAADGVDDAAVPLLRSGAAAAVAEFTQEFDDGVGLIGTHIGPYRLTGVLGQGGTSVVFRAERPIGAGNQTVALKLLRTGLFSADSQRRFHREQAVLSQLSHPHIASLIDGGIDAAGVPYIAMEFVDGLPITDYANANALDLAGRLRLLVTVCRAVDSAHRALVVHRDLKPSNILVGRNGAAKVLDFGIAQMLDADNHKFAQTQVISLTPGYAAPEQYLPGPVTTATDIYALGVLLGELLTGRLVTPDPLQPGLSRAFTDGGHVAQSGLPSATVLRRLLRGDLGAIHSTACAQEPDRRYGSAALLANDLECYLQKRPVSARAPSLGYRLRKYAQRNKAAASAAALALLAIVLGVSLALWQARVAQEEGRRSSAVSEFLMELFDASKPGQLPEQRVTLEQLVHRASARLQEKTDISALARIDMLRLLGEVSMAASDFEGAERLLNTALTLSSTVYSPTDPVPMRIRLLIANLRILQTRYADAAQAYEAILPNVRKAGDALSIKGLQDYAFALMYSARTERALAISAEATQAAANLYGNGSQGAALASLAHGDMLLGAGRHVAATAVIGPALLRWRQAAWPPTPDFLRGLRNLANAQLALGDIGAAEQLARENLATAEKIYASPHEYIGEALLNLSHTLVEQERFDEAEQLLTRALAMFRAIYGNGQMREANTLSTIGLVKLSQHDLSAAEQAVRQGQLWCATRGLHPTRTCIELDAGETRIALAQGDLDRADVSSARALAMAEKIFHEGGDETAELMQLRAAVMLGRGDPAAALALCDRAWTMLVSHGETNGSTAVAVAARRAEVFEAMHRYAEAQTEIHRALSVWQQLVPAGVLRRAELLASLARLQCKDGDQKAAATGQFAFASVKQEMQGEDRAGCIK